MEELWKVKPIKFKMPSLKRNDFLSVLNAMVDDKIYPGELYARFAEVVTQITSFKYPVFVPSRWMAWNLAIKAFFPLNSVKPERVLISNNSLPVYVDFFDGFNMKPEPLEISDSKLIPEVDEILSKSPDEKSLIFISYPYGYPAEFKGITSVDNLIFGDFSGSFFTFLENEHIGLDFDCAVFSLKDEDIVSTGDGVLLAVKDKKIYEKIDAIVTQYNLRLSDYNCSLGLSQMEKINSIVRSRKKIFDMYCSFCRSNITIIFSDGIDGKEGYRPNFNSFNILIEDAYDDLIQLLETLNIEYRPIIEKPISLLVRGEKRFVNTEKICKKGIALPLYPTMTNQDVERVEKVLKKI